MIPTLLSPAKFSLLNYLLDTSICMSHRHFKPNVAKVHFGFFSSKLVLPFGFLDIENGINTCLVSHDKNLGLSPSPWTSNWSFQTPCVLQNHSLFISLYQLPMAV